MLIIRSRKQQMTEGIEFPNQENIRTFGEKKTYKYLGILEADIIKKAEMKEKIKCEYLRSTRNVSETKLNSRTLFKGINIWALPLVRYLDYS